MEASTQTLFKPANINTIVFKNIQCFNSKTLYVYKKLVLKNSAPGMIKMYKIRRRIQPPAVTALHFAGIQPLCNILYLIGYCKP